jgi:hypothetical protein
MRALVALLLLANLGFFALAQGWLQPFVGLSTLHEREPQRLAAQRDAASVRIVATGPDRSTEDTAACLQAGPFGPEQVEAAEAALVRAQHAPDSWRWLPAEGLGAAAQAAPQPMYLWLRVERPDAALRQQLQALAETVPAGSVKACATSR